MTQPAPLAEFPVAKIHEANRQAQLIYASMGSSLIAYFIVSRFVSGNPPVSDNQLLRYVLIAAAISAIFVATVVKGLLLRTVPPTAEARLARLRSAAVITAAIAETPAVFGFILVFVTGRTTEFYTLLIVSAYILARHFPRREPWETYVRRGTDAR